MAYIGQDIEGGVLAKQTLATNGVLTSFELDHFSDANGLIVSVQGVIQEPGVAYTVSGKTITFTTAPTTTTYVVFIEKELTVASVKPLDYIDYRTGTGNGSATPLTLSHTTSNPQDIMVTLNGVTQRPTTDYTVSGTTLTFTTAPVNGMIITVYHLNLRRTEGVVLDGSVTDSKIVSMDAAKLTGSLPSSLKPLLSEQFRALSSISLHWASVNNKSAMNLQQDFIDHFQDSTGVDSTNSVNAVVSSDEYVTSASELDTATNIAPSGNDWDYTFASNHWTTAGNSLGDHTVGGYVDGQGNSGLSSLTTLDGNFVIKWTSDNDEGVTFGVASITDDGSRSQSDGIGMHSSGIESYYYREAGGNINKFWIGNSVESGNAYVFADGSEIVMRRVSGTITIEDDGVVVHTFSTTNSNPVRFFIANNQTSKVDISDLTIEDTEKVQRDGMFDATPGLDASNIGAGASRKYRGTFFKATRTGKVTGLKVYVHNVNTAGTFHAELWTHNGTSPGSQIGSNSNSINFNSTGAKNFTFTDPTVIKGQTYWMVLVDDGSSGAVEMRDYLNAHPQNMGGGRVNDAATSLTDNGGAAILRIEVAIDTSVGEPTPDHDTLLLIQSDTTNGSTTFADTSQNARTITVTGDSQHSTSRKKFGSSSMYFDGTQDHLKLPNSTDWNFGTNDFTIDYWVNGISGNDAAIIRFGNENVPSTGKAAGFGYISSGGQLKLYLSSGSSWDIASSVNMGAYPTGDEWVHFAVVRKQNTWTTYRNGTQVSTFTNSSSLNTTGGGGNNLHIMDDWGTAGTMATGYIDGIRISRVARWDANFTPPSAPYLTSTKSTTTATGSLISKAQTAEATVSNATGVILYDDGTTNTSTIGTDLKTYFSSDNGTNWTEAVSYGNPITFNGTTKLIPLGSTTLTGGTGTAVKMKTEWANQVAPLGTEKSISPVGDANFSSSQVKIGASSIHFDGTDDFLTVADSSDFNFGSGDFTIEYWINESVGGMDNRHMGRNMTTSNGGFLLGGFSGGANDLAYFSSNGSSHDIKSGMSLGNRVVNGWSHIAVVRNGNVFTSYRDGIQADTFTSSAALFNGSGDLAIGAYQNSTNSLNGYMDEIRLSNTARYTANFTPSTTAFTSDANTKLLIHSDTTDDGSVLDSSSNGYTINKIGSVPISAAQKKFGISSLYFPKTSGNINTQNYLAIADNATWDYGTGDFTWEMWVNVTAIDRQMKIFGSEGWSDGGAYDWIFDINPDRRLRVSLYNGSTSQDINTPSGQTLPVSTWTHLAVCRNTGVITIYINGVAKVSEARAESLANLGTPYLGWKPENNQDGFAGYMDEVRLSNVARYTSAGIGNSAFTPSTTAFTSDANTQLLLHADDAATTFTDSSSNTHTVTAVGDAKHQPPVKKIGNSSLYFDGTGDYLNIPSSSDWVFSGDFTLELWVRKTVNNGGDNAVMITYGTDQDWGQNGFIFRLNGSDQISFQRNNGSGGAGFTLNGSTALSTNVWYHAAIVRSGTTYKLYLNGTEDGTNTVGHGAIQSLGHPLRIGADKDVTTSTVFKAGYMDEIRVSDTARYTANFTPSTTAFTTDANTLLLIHGDSTNPFAKISLGGTALAHSHAGSNTASKAFDNNTGTYWIANETAAAGTGVSYIGYDVGSGNAFEMSAFSILGRQNGNSDNWVSSVIVRYSDDGTSWTNHETIALSTTYSTTEQFLSVKSGAGSHRYWSLLANADMGSSSSWGVAELDFFEGDTITDDSEKIGKLTQLHGWVVNY